MKKFLSLSLFVIVLFSFTSCSNKNNSNTDQKETITLNKNNFEEYININFDFEESDIQIKQEPAYVGSDTLRDMYYVSCLCRISISAKGAYEFGKAKLVLFVSSRSWKIEGGSLEISPSSSVPDSDTQNITLNADGSYSFTVIFSKRTTNASALHPLQNKDWSYQIKSIEGTVTE